MTNEIPATPDPAWHDVAATGEFTDGSMRGYTVAGREVVVCRTREGQWHALDNICTHGFVKMHEGRLRGVRLICPLHGASFDCRNGNVLGAPATKPLACWQLKIEADRVLVAPPSA
jgi:nitrite reductase/ring-hydroxylating ferredoxin subunit